MKTRADVERMLRLILQQGFEDDGTFMMLRQTLALAACHDQTVVAACIEAAPALTENKPEGALNYLYARALWTALQKTAA